jgi:hypothetical protein
MKFMQQALILVILLSMSGQTLAFQTDIENAGMVYLQVPLDTNTLPAPNRSIMGFRFGQTRISTDTAGSLFTYFRTRPALVDVSFGLAGRNNSTEDIRFGLLDLKLSGISAVEKTYINGQAVVGDVATERLLIGGAAIAGIGIVAIMSNSSDDADEPVSTSTSTDTTENNDETTSTEPVNEPTDETDQQTEVPQDAVDAPDAGQQETTTDDTVNDPVDNGGGTT